MKRTGLGIIVALSALTLATLFTLFAPFARRNILAGARPIDAGAAPFDIVIRDGRILDGTGSPSHCGDRAAWQSFREAHYRRPPARDCAGIY